MPLLPGKKSFQSCSRLAQGPFWHLSKIFFLVSVTKTKTQNRVQRFHSLPLNVESQIKSFGDKLFQTAFPYDLYSERFKNES
jgi:hypothetical protein